MYKLQNWKSIHENPENIIKVCILVAYIFRQV